MDVNSRIEDNVTASDSNSSEVVTSTEKPNTEFVEEEKTGYPEDLSTYSKWGESGGYDKFITINYTGPRHAAEAVAEIFGDHKETRILDVAAGTGAVGKELSALGFTNLEAVEPSEGMVEAAKKLGVYKKFHPYFMDGSELDIPADSYDAIVISGGFVKGHLPNIAIKEMIRLIKPGGYWVNAMREEYLWTVPEYRTLEAYKKQLEDQGAWTQISRKKVEKYVFDFTGLVYVYRIL